MKKYYLIFVLLFIWACGKSQNSKAINAQSFENSITEKQADLIFQNSNQFPNGTEIAIALIVDGVPKFYGINRQNDTLRTTQNHQNLFEIGSITKVFTATLLADFVLHDRVSLDDHIAPYLNFNLKEGQKITFKQLANHTSGLYRLPSNMDLFTNPQNPYIAYDEEKLKAYLTENLLLVPENERGYTYSNLGAGLLGFTLSKIENTSYSDLLHQRIFSKYEMGSSTGNRNEIEGLLIKGLNDKGEEVSNWDFDVLAGAGALFSSVDDLSKFAMAQFNSENKTLALTRQTTFKISANQAIGLGWHIRKNKDEVLFWHNGGTGGYRSCMVVDTDSKNAVVVLSNVSAFNSDSNKIDTLCFALIETLQ